MENKKKILIVEDEEPVLSALFEKLVREGFEAIKARDGEEGLDISLREKPDLILLDIIMPKMDGLTMMKRLRETNDWGKNVPIILLTNLSPDDNKTAKSIADNFPASYLVKTDWKLSDVVQKIRERLGVPADMKSEV